MLKLYRRTHCMIIYLKLLESGRRQWEGFFFFFFQPEATLVVRSWPLTLMSFQSEQSDGVDTELYLICLWGLEGGNLHTGPTTVLLILRWMNFFLLLGLFVQDKEVNLDPRGWQVQATVTSGNGLLTMQSSERCKWTTINVEATGTCLGWNGQ